MEFSASDLVVMGYNVLGLVPQTVFYGPFSCLLGGCIAGKNDSLPKKQFLEQPLRAFRDLGSS